ncbi:MAG TPA: bifunctional [glutamine synthetase] adenylyltransferase/[glutamine synthetase]-adenylyl-L-tyrosine phosphorylase [Allosphingosinicella sp.]|nr:bifunctional [glutamine synthetase] adenylyltransferase/[glutamine synthetase]-adenylyl-L-tyrosine phosphorylase [Allosphingosinicella sp.]
MKETQSKREVNRALDRARLHSPYLRQQLAARTAVAAALEAGSLDDAFAAARREGDDTPDPMAALRRERNGLSLALGIGDLSGILSLSDVVERLSALADRALDRAVRTAIAERTPGEEPRGFAVIAMGKLGSCELNYSSDVDVILLFNPATLPRRPREDVAEAAVRIGKRVADLLQKKTEDGFAFRVDLRLRPSPEVTPIVLPVEAAIGYYESSALPWERAAFIRARFVAGDPVVGRYFLDAVHPFVWRRSLDFGAIGEIQSITRRIRDHYAQGQAFGPGYDLKRGRGGIREIEFFAQIHQLIHGGRDPALRVPDTLGALKALGDAGRIDAAEAEALAESYTLLRTIEHRLQMVEDRQTHELPKSAEEMDNVARLHGLEDGAALIERVRPAVTQVARAYDALDAGEGDLLPEGAEPLEARLAAAGFTDPVAARLRVEGWRSGKVRALRSPPARAAFEAMLPVLVEAFGKAPDAMRAVNRFDQLVERLPSGINFFRLLEAQPELTRILATVLSHAPVLAEQLGRRAELLDTLIDSSAFAPVPPVETLIEDFRRSDRAGEDYQLVLDRVRRLVNERRFALGVQLVAAASDPIEVAEGYSRIAEAAINVLADATVAEFEKRHGKVPGSELLILGLGRLGGEALTHASDLDLVYLFSGTHDNQSDGPKPLRATDYFNRLGPRVTAALSVATAAGPLYDVDTRLRPSGTDGMHAISVETFARYYIEQAWTWEHMALTRARPVYGSSEARAALREEILAVLSRPRDAAKLTEDTRSMRAEIARNKPPSGPLDVKLMPGGLVDLEFAVHTLQLRRGIGLDPHLEVALAALAKAGLVSPDIDPALRLLVRMLVMIRLVAPAGEPPPEATRPLVAAACGQKDWDSLLEACADARQRIAALWRDVSSSAS